MKNFVLASVVLSGLLCAGLISAQEQKGPRIEVKEMQHNFGKVAQGTQVSHVFQIRNAGDEPLVVERIAATWGCTAAVISSNHLDPGAVGQIKATVDTTGRSGSLVKHINIYSNDRTNPVTTVAVIMDVVPK